MLIGRQEWVYSIVQNYCSKQKQKTEVCYTFYSIIMYTLYLYSWKNEILIMQLNNLYHDFSRTIKNIPASFRLSFLKIADLTVFLLFSIWKLLSHRGDIEENPGHKYSLLTFCHWNLNGLTAHDSTEISLLQAYISKHNHDIICLAETFLNSSIQSDDDRITTYGYDLFKIRPSKWFEKRWSFCLL